jgi:hypothetical protein
MKTDRATETAPFDYVHYLTLLEPYRVFAVPMPPPGARLREWRWPPVKPYNGFSGELRVWVWQLQCWAYDTGALARPKACALCGNGSRVVYHSENYADPWTSIALCQGCHMSVHGRFRHPEAWDRFQARHRRHGVKQWFDVLTTTPINLENWLKAEPADRSKPMSTEHVKPAS